MLAVLQELHANKFERIFVPKNLSELVPLNVRIPLNLKLQIDIAVKSRQDTSMQAAIQEAMERWLRDIESSGTVGLLSPKDRLVIEDFAKALLRRTQRSISAYKLLEALYEDWDD